MNPARSQYGADAFEDDFDLEFPSESPALAGSALGAHPPVDACMRPTREFCGCSCAVEAPAAPTGDAGFDFTSAAFSPALPERRRREITKKPATRRTTNPPLATPPMMAVDDDEDDADDGGGTSSPTVTVALPRVTAMTGCAYTGSDGDRRRA